MSPEKGSQAARDLENTSDEEWLRELRVFGLEKRGSGRAYHSTAA